MLKKEIIKALEEIHEKAFLIYQVKKFGNTVLLRHERNRNLHTLGVDL